MKWSRVAPCLCVLAACSAPAGPEIAGVDVAQVLPQSAAIVGRDGGSSGLAWGRSVWTFGDTVLATADEHGQTWHHNSISITDDLDASDGIGGFVEPLDAAGAPAYFLAPTDDELAFNLAHAGDACATPPCGARFACWPGAPLFDPARSRALSFYELIYAEPGDFNFSGVGRSLALWTDIAGAPERPIVAPGSEHPTLLFPPGRLGWGTAGLVVGDDGYVFACDGDGLSRPCRLARFPLGTPFDLATWRYWDGDDWGSDESRAAELFDGAPIVSVSHNDYLGGYVAIYAPPVSDDIVVRFAPELTGPWSRETVMYTAHESRGPYDAMHHAEYELDGGRVTWVSYSRPTTGWFGAEFVLLRVTFE